MTDMLGVIKEYTEAVKQGNAVPTQGQPKESSPKPPTPPPPQQTYRPQPDPVPPYDSDDFNFRNNETVVESTVHVQKHVVPESGKARLMAQKKRDREIEQAMARAKAAENAANKSSYVDALNKKKTGKRGRKPKDYIIPVDEEQIAEAIILSETKNIDKDKIEGLD